MTTNVCRAHKLNPYNVTTPDCTRKRAPEMSNREPYITSKSPFHNSKEPLISHKGAITKQFTLYIAREPGEPRKTTPACCTCGTCPFDTVPQVRAALEERVLVEGSLMIRKRALYSQ